MRTRFHHLFTYALSKPAYVFKLFELSFPKVFLYFIVLNLIMLLPLSLGIIRMDSINYEQFGFDVVEDGPSWLPTALPDCSVNDLKLSCDSDDPYVYPFEFMDSTYDIHFNVMDEVAINDPYTMVFKESSIVVNLQEGITLQLDYRGFEGMDFNEVAQMEEQVGSELFFNAFFRSLHPTLVLPFIIIAIGGLFLMNTILLLIYSGISVMFKYVHPEVPNFKNMFKLYVIATTIPAMINLVLGIFGLSPFTSIIFNFMTPLLVLWYFKKNINRINQAAI